MSAIAGVVHLDGRPSDPEVLRQVADGLTYRAPDGVTIWRDGCAGLVHGGLVTTPESALERQPFADASAGAVIAFDGRLDNRDELLRALDLAGVAARAVGDAELTLRAYRRFGGALVDRLLGDFAFVIWDAPRRRLVCVRDAMGIKPLYYRIDRAAFSFATDIAVVAARTGSIPEPNEGMAGEYLAGTITDKHETLFRDVYRLPPAHVLTAEAGSITVRRYWQPDPNREVRYRRDEDYVEHLSDLVRNAVAARLRTRTPAGVMLSGGVDSSSITAVGAQLWRAGAVPCCGIETFSIGVPGPADETEYFEHVIDRWNLPAHRFRAQLPVPGQFREAIGRDLDIHTYPHAPTLDLLYRRARDRGVRVMLTGVGGDEWLGTSPWAYADLLKCGRLMALVRRLRLDSTQDDFLGWRAAAKASLWPFLPPAAARVIRRALGRGQPPPWLNATFAARIDLRERLARHESDVAFRSFEPYDMWHEGTSGTAVHSMEMFDRSSAPFHVEHAHPLLDRRIVEFGLAIPADQRWRDGRPKDLWRRAMSRHVPPAIAGRCFSPGAAHALVQAIDAEGGSAPFDALAIERSAWIRGEEVRRMHGRMTDLYRRGDDGYTPLAWTLWLVLAMELWLQAVTTARPAAIVAGRPATETVVQ